MNNNKASSTLPFPWKCRHCGKVAVRPAIVSYPAEVNHDGRIYKFTVDGLKAPTCSECRTVFPDGEANRQITASFRHEAKLLPPDLIRQNREALELTQKQFAASLGVAEATVSRWETGGQIQQRSLDGLMRIFFEFPDVRLALMDENSLPQLGLAIQTFQHVNGGNSLAARRAIRKDLI